MVCFDLFGNKYIVSEEYKACIFRSDMWGDSNKRNFKIPYKKDLVFTRSFQFIYIEIVLQILQNSLRAFQVHKKTFHFFSSKIRCLMDVYLNRNKNK